MPRPLALAVLAALAGCSSSETGPGVATASATLAAPGVTAYYAFRTSGEGTSTSVRAVPVRPDSVATTAWDVGLRGVEVLLNGGTSGPGAGVGVVEATPFEAVTDARLEVTPYRRDGQSPCPTGPARAVCVGPDGPDSWYTLGPAGAVAPIPGRTLVVRLGDNRGFAKVEFQGYTGDRAAGAYDLRFTVNPQGPSFFVSDGD